MNGETVTRPPSAEQTCQHLEDFARFYADSPVILLAIPDSENAVVAGCAACDSSDPKLIERGQPNEEASDD